MHDHGEGISSNLNLVGIYPSGFGLVNLRRFHLSGSLGNLCGAINQGSDAHAGTGTTNRYSHLGVRLHKLFRPYHTQWFHGIRSDNFKRT